MTRSNIKKKLSTVQSGSPSSRIIHALSKNGGMTSAQIARQTGLARSTISTAVAELKASHVVVETGKEETEKAAAGRPGIVLTLNPQAGTCMGLHLAYDKLEIVVADMSHTIIAEETIPLSVDYSPQDAMSAVKHAYAELYRPSGLASSRLLGVGIAVSGPVQRDGVLQRGGILPRWVGVNIQHLFSEIFKCAVIVDNESNCSALAEMKWGAARGYDDFAIFKMDVGVGGAIVCNGQVLRGAAGAAGEFGHVSINPEGELCRCGNRGCLELYASFVKPLEQLSKVHKKRITMEAAIALAEAGDAGALRMIADVAEYGGRGLAMIGTILNPPLIVIGGRMALTGDLLLKPMTTSFHRHTLVKHNDAHEHGQVHCDIRIGKFTENDSLLGAVALVLDNPRLAAMAS